ncbi:hypothetical protein D9M68_581970 [compost metagenome]
MNEQHFADTVHFTNKELINQLVEFAFRNGQPIEETYLVAFVEMVVFASNHRMSFPQLEQAIQVGWKVANADRGELQ